jgi:uncharacterized membrane protein
MDYVWITSQQGMYGKLVAGVQGSPMKVNLTAAAIAYAFVVMCFIGIVVPSIRGNGKKSFSSSFARGAIIGLGVYGVYNATNASIFSNYSTFAAIVDTIWGTLLFGTCAAIFTFAAV